MDYAILTLRPDGSVADLTPCSSGQFRPDGRENIEQIFLQMAGNVDHLARLVMAEYEDLELSITNGMTLPMITAMRESWDSPEPWDVLQRMLYCFCEPDKAMPFAMMAVIDGDGRASLEEPDLLGDAQCAACSMVYSHAVGLADYDKEIAGTLFWRASQVRPCAVVAWSSLPPWASEAYRDIVCRLAPAIACIHLERRHPDDPG